MPKLRYQGCVVRLVLRAEVVLDYLQVDCTTNNLKRISYLVGGRRHVVEEMSAER